jgi:LysM repeat protein
MIQKLTATIFIFFVLVQAHAQTSFDTEEYIRTFAPMAIKEMQRTGVPAAIKLAQGILESNSGQSELVLKSNNHFGIKCKNGYTGPYVLHDDDAPKEHFMKYENPEQSYIDHSDFLKTRSRYAFLFKFSPEDYQSWAYGLKKAGYATNPRYAQKLIDIIEKYNLQNYTLMALKKAEMIEETKPIFVAVEPIQSAQTVQSKYPENDFIINKTRVVFVKKGISLNDVANQFHTTPELIFRCNDFSDNTIISAQDRLVFLQLKRTEGENEFYEVKEGENVYDIAQQLGIRLESLLKYNHLTKSSTLAGGTKLYLQNIAEKNN